MNWSDIQVGVVVEINGDLLVAVSREAESADMLVLSVAWDQYNHWVGGAETWTSDMWVVKRAKIFYRPESVVLPMSEG